MFDTTNRTISAWGSTKAIGISASRTPSYTYEGFRKTEIVVTQFQLSAQTTTIAGRAKDEHNRRQNDK